MIVISKYQSFDNIISFKIFIYTAEIGYFYFLGYQPFSDLQNLVTYALRQYETRMTIIVRVKIDKDIKSVHKKVIVEP